MENSTQPQINRPAAFWRWCTIALLALIGFNFAFDVQITPRKFLFSKEKSVEKTNQTVLGGSSIANETDATDYGSIVFPSQGFALPIAWGTIGKQIVKSGVIDDAKYESLMKDRGLEFGDFEKAVLSSDMKDTPLIMTNENANFLLNVLWAFGLGNKNPILETGPISDEQYGGASGFASTGGWTLAKGNAMDHFNKHEFVKLTDEQQQLAVLVSKNIYRPCCGNSTYFPDCNHGMAMLGLLEIMASQGVSEEDMYRTALQVNAYWFPDTYLTIAKYLASQGLSWNQSNPQQLLSYDYSSSQGYKNIQSKVEPVDSPGGGGCGV